MKNICLLFLLGFTMIGCNVGNGDIVDQLFQAYDGDKPGAVVMVIQDGEAVFSRSYGMANVETGEKMTTAHSLRLASISKQFTASAILLLMERGKLDSSTTLTSIFPDFPDYGEAITIHHLLQHTSGLLDYESLVEDSLEKQLVDSDVLKIMMQQDSTYFEPGSEFRYSNSGYAVLAMIVEEISGQTFSGFLEEHIFEPLKMLKTVAHQKGVSQVYKRAYGHTIENSRATVNDQSRFSAVLGDGGIYTSVEELMLWDAAQYNDLPLSEDSRRRMTTPEVDIYGYGLRIDTYKEFKRIHHAGSTRGFRNFMQRFPDKKLTIIILTNRSEPDVTPLANKIADHYLN
ncbi:MAG: serine hydrolase domain-containing protein [Calditrichota bacterium]